MRDEYNLTVSKGQHWELLDYAGRPKRVVRILGIRDDRPLVEVESDGWMALIPMTTFICGARLLEAA